MENELTLLQNLSKKIDKVLSGVPSLRENTIIEKVQSLYTGEVVDVTMRRNPIVGQYGTLRLNNIGMYSYTVANDVPTELEVTENFTLYVYDRANNIRGQISFSVTC